MRRKSSLLIAVSAFGLGLGSSALAGVVTGPFLPTGPLTNAFLSVDMNGGPLTSASAPTNGWNESTSAGAFSADNFGVVWSPWGGNAYAGGDGTQLPSSQSSPNVVASSISKTFSINGPPVSDNSYFSPAFTGQTTVSPPVTATLSEAGTASNYGTVGGSESMNSRDRGSPSGANGLNDNDMFRDLIFAGTSGSNVQSTNYLQLSLTGLDPNTPYEIALYSYDSTGSHTMNWTATAPFANTTDDNHFGWNPDNASELPAGYTFVAAGDFVAPMDEQSITWTAGTTPAPAVFTLNSDPNGNLTVYGWGGNGLSNGQSADTSYLDGFQLAVVPEPASLGLICVAGAGLLLRRRSAK